MFDPMFRIPLLTGGALALLLPILGCLLRLRGEWLAALGLAHVSGATALLGLALHLPLTLGAGIGAFLGAAAKSFLAGRGNTAYGFMILTGWSTMFLLAANTPLGQAIAHALADGQLYFATVEQLMGAVVLLVLGVPAYPWLSHRLLRAHLLPEDDRANGRYSWRWHFGFDLIVALVLALATTSLGLMAAFALVFLPPWTAFRIAGSWRSAVLFSAALALSGYAAAFWLALTFDQPFGPVLVALLLAMCGVAVLVKARRGG